MIQRAKSAQRLRYEAEVAAIRRRVGGLEEIRARLGVSQRQMAKLLFVDPSAWTRWTRAEEDAPPLVYRALQWFLAVEDKYPVLDMQFWLRASGPAPTDETRALHDEIGRLAKDVRRLEDEQRAALEGRATAVRELEIRLSEAEHRRNHRDQAEQTTGRVGFMASLTAALLLGVLIGLWLAPQFR